MRILITGSSGQIGTNLGLQLLAAGHSVYGVDIRSNTWTDKIQTIVQDLSLPYRDFDAGINNVKYPDKLDAVVHLAAHAKVHALVEDPFCALQNINMTFNVLEFCRKNRIPIILSSTREVYGDIHRYITEESYADFAFTESPYSASKISSEAFIYSYSKCYGLPYFVFRLSNVYGRYDNDLERMERVVPLFIQKISNHETLTVYGENKTLDFTYVDDCVAGLIAGIELLVSGKEKNHTINLAFGQGNTLITLAQYIGDILEVLPRIEVQPSRPGEVTHYIANIGKARALLGYNPETSLLEGIRKTIEWNQKWLGSSSL